MTSDQPKNRGEMPWEPKPIGSNEVLWRDSRNPIINRFQHPNSNSIFNSAVIPFKDGFAGVFRCDDKAVTMNLYVGFSDDGINWKIEENAIQMKVGDAEFVHSDYRYDPRITEIDGTYWLTWCNGYHGPTIGIARTEDFVNFYQYENAFLPFNRNGVLFPKKIDGKYVMLSRPSDNGHTAFGDIYLSKSPDMKYWGEHRVVMKTSAFEVSGWQSTKIGAGPVPILIDEGWLMIYHGVINTCNGFRYAMGGAILDRNDPSKVLYRSKNYLLGPAELYETSGDVPNVVFPCAALHEDDKIAIYYGAADTTVCVCYGHISELVAYIKAYSY